MLDHRIDQVAFEADPAWDGARITQEVARAAGNRAPALVQALPVLQARIGESLAYTVATGTIVDPDPGDGVRYSLRTATGGALPSWLVFDPATRTLTAQPGAGDAGSLQLELRGADRYGLAVAAGLTLRVSDPVQRGTPGNDALAASALGDTLEGGAGQDSLMGGALGDTYLFALGDGRDTITETAAGGSGIDRLVFGPGIAPDDITVRRGG